jgi:hypothetical protein
MVGAVFCATEEERRGLPDLRAFNAYAWGLMVPYAASRLPLVFGTCWERRQRIRHCARHISLRW